MERDALAELSREQLVELVLALAAEVAELKAQQGQPPKTPGNSAVPPSVGFKANRAERRARSRGDQSAAPAAGCDRTLPSDDLAAPDPAGGDRGMAVRGTLSGLWDSDQRHVSGRAGADADVRATDEALLGYFHERHHVSYERLVEIWQDVFGLRVSEGGIDHALQRLAERARPTYEAIREQVRGSPVINSDETGARVAGRNQWQWVFQTPEASYHVIVPSRGGEVIDAFLGDVEPAVWGSDLWAPQLLTSATAHQICMSHQARDLTFAVEADGYTGRV